MAFEIDNYGRLVLEDYYQKRDNGSLGAGLMELTPAGLRDECLRAYRERYLEKDEKAIKDFFVAGSKSKTLLEIIEQYGLGKFKAIINYLNSDGAIKTKAKNVFLLAWLIDFEDRPYVYGRKYGDVLAEVLARKGNLAYSGNPASEPDKENRILSVDEEFVIPEILKDDVDNDELAAAVSEETTKAGSAVENTVPGIFAGGRAEFKRLKRKFPIRQTLTLCTLVLFLGIGGYWWWVTQSRNNLPFEHGGCMYWAEDHYQPIPCNQKVPNTLVVALDTVKVKTFRKITLPDTITNRAKGYVWYSKIDNKYEFFTADGQHPVVFGRRLKPITDYIIDKHIKPGMTSN